MERTDDIMQTFCYTLQDEFGMHARPANLLSRIARQFSSDIRVRGNSRTADAKRIMQLMQLDVDGGDEITIYVDGEDETQAVQAMLKALSEHL